MWQNIINRIAENYDFQAYVAMVIIIGIISIVAAVIDTWYKADMRKKSDIADQPTQERQISTLEAEIYDWRKSGL